MTTETKRSSQPGFRRMTSVEGRNARLLERIEDAAIFCAFALALSFMATSAVMVVYA